MRRSITSNATCLAASAFICAEAATFCRSVVRVRASSSRCKSDRGGTISHTTGIDVALVVRTTRSVQLTDAGAQLVQLLEGPLVDIGSALDATGTTDAPRGHLRLTATSIAEPFLSGPLLASFAERYPDVTIDVTVTDEEFDIVERGFDAGIRLGQVIEKDMIAVPLGGEQRVRAQLP
ncbi:hypothetical protein G3O00_06900 [Burkholderia sp. Ac-20384]|nr:LysR substrate-binding domain-containing protein [Burkholderia sp. Ac-20384]MBN3823345.1 hypothetical protein [Burkholderia sp. Ac-20384]